MHLQHSQTTTGTVGVGVPDGGGWCELIANGYSLLGLCLELVTPITFDNLQSAKFLIPSEVMSEVSGCGIPEVLQSIGVFLYVYLNFYDFSLRAFS